MSTPMRQRLLLLLLMIPVLLSAQTAPWGMLTQEEGLHNSSVTCILRDHRGFVYLGTELGVSRFDGVDVLNVDFPADAAHNLAVTCMLEQDDRHLLVGNKAGLWQLDRRRLTLGRTCSDVIDMGVNDLLRTADGTIMVATARGLYRLQGRKATAVNIFRSSHVATRNVQALTACDRRAWLLVGREVMCLNPKADGVARTMALPAPGGQLSPTALTAIGRHLYIGTAAGTILSLDVRSGKCATLLSGLSAITGLSTDNGRHLLVATGMDGSLEVEPRSGKVTRRYCPQEVASDMTVVPTRLASPVFFRRFDDGTNWISYKFFGVDYSLLNRGIFHTFSIPGTFDSGGHAVRTFLRDGQRTLVGTRNGLYVVDAARHTAKHIAIDHSGGGIISCIRKVGAGYLVGAIGSGLFMLDATTLAVRPAPQFRVLAGANIYDIVDDGKGALWISSSAGLTRYDTTSGSVRHFTTRNSQLPDNEVFCIGFDDSGRGWCSTAGGQCMWDPALQMVTTRSLLPRLVNLGLLRAVNRLPGGRLLFIPQKGQPAVLDPASGAIQLIDLSKKGLGDTFIDIRPIGGGQFVVTCPEAVYLVSRQGPARRFGHIDGLVNSQFQSHAVKVDPQGIFWAATNGGLVWARLRDIRRTTFPHMAISIAEIQTDHWFSPEEVSGVLLDSLLSLSRHDNTFTVKFTPLVYGNTRDITFRYRLEGHDHGWHTASATRIINYRNLWPGRYTLRIEAVGMPELSGELRIDVPMTSGAIMLSILLILLVALTAHVLWCRHYKKPYIWKRLLPQPEKYQRSHLSKEEARRLQQQLLELMEKEKPYLNPDLQVSTLAKALGCSTHSLSQLFSQVMHRNYYDFVAEYRVKAFKKLAQDPSHRNLTITALAEQCGFKSRNPFLVAFKKYTGMTPKDYMKSLQ